MSRRISNTDSPSQSEKASAGIEMWRDLDMAPSTGAQSIIDVVDSNRDAAAAGQSALTVGRRGFLGLTGAGAAFALSGCIRRPAENILPYAKQPEHLLPGKALHFASATSRRGEGIGLLVTSHEGRPTKVDGNPEHPGSQGGLDVYGQLSVMDLYDPDRARKPGKRTNVVLDDMTYADVDELIADLVFAHERDGGRGLRVLMQSTTSPSTLRMKAKLLERFPTAKVYSYDSVNETNIREGARIAFGRPVAASVDYAKAAVVLSLDSDFLSTEPGALRAARGFAEGRAIRRPTQSMNRLYVVEATHSVTGAAADHRLRMPSRDIEGYLLALAKTLQARPGFDLGGLASVVSSASTEGIPAQWLDAVAADLQDNAGKAAIVVGSRQPARVHALAHLLNRALGNEGRTVQYYPVADESEGDQLDEIRKLTTELKSGRIKTLFILGGNPVYDAPVDVDFAGALGTKGLKSVQLSTHRDETSALVTWHIPQAHELEAWGDHRAIDGTTAVQQPMIAPLFGGRSALEILAHLAGERNWRGHYVVRRTFRNLYAGTRFEATWRKILHRGVALGQGVAPIANLAMQEGALKLALGSTPERKPLGADNVEVIFACDARLFDGRHANNLWALELPDPMTKVVWDNAAIISKRTRDALGLRQGDMVSLSKGDTSIEVPVWALPGHADDCVTLHLGWGRSAAGRYGNGKGFDVQKLRSSEGFYFADGFAMAKTGKTYQVVQTQTHHHMEERPIAIHATKEHYEEHPNFPQWPSTSSKSDGEVKGTVEFTTGPLWSEVDYSKGHRWGMTIDLSSCTGCGACTIACQSENNIPVVGKYEVERGREMSWMRLDRYFIGDMDDPQVAMQPVGCQHCEEAPCENVCPVAATTHSPEGLNDMAYNRCVGTRYCANNCPYKVRRFNYFDWHTRLDTEANYVVGTPTTASATYGNFPEMRKMQFNPNVTVRMRGVIEKCTFCVQRIQQAKIVARREDRKLVDGEVQTACQQTCPSKAITFGDINDSRSAVHEIAQTDRGYRLLAEVGAQPRVTYLAKIQNPNPAMAAEAAEEA